MKKSFLKGIVHIDPSIDLKLMMKTTNHNWTPMNSAINTPNLTQQTQSNFKLNLRENSKRRSLIEECTMNSKKDVSTTNR